MKTPQPPKDKIRTFEVRYREARSTDDGTVEDPGGLVGPACVLGELDSYRTIPVPWSVDDAMMARFVKRGRFLQGHQARELPIGFIRSCGKVGRAIQVETSYFTDEKAQRCRQIAKELVDAGKSVALSIGFEVAQYEYFENGKACIKALRERAVDMSLFNVEQIEAHEQYCWLMYISDIWEVSDVNFASNDPSQATDIRSVSDDKFWSDLIKMATERGVKIKEASLVDMARSAGILEERAIPAEPEEVIPVPDLPEERHRKLRRR